MIILLLLVAPTVLVWCGLRAPAAWEWLCDRAPRPAPLPTTSCRPLELLAADLRRLGARRHALRLDADVPARATKVLAAERAYDDRLAEAADALGVDHLLPLARSLGDRSERRRVEAALADAGLDLAAPAGC